MHKINKNMREHVSVCVFCSSSNHISDIYKDAAVKLGGEMSRRGFDLVYGGGNNGLMGVLSQEVHESGGKIIGVIPRKLHDMGFGYKNVDEMIVTEDMRVRKTVMEERADAFIGMAGGFGTLEEILELITLKQLEMHHKPIVLLNTGNFFSGLLEQFEKSYTEKFVGEKYRKLYHVTVSVSDALDCIIASRKKRIN